MLSQIETLNLTWVLMSSALVFLMQAGFCMLETGLVRAKNSINVAIKNLVDFCISSLLFWLIGFGIMFGASAGGWFGTTGFCFDDTQSPHLAAFFLFQLVFCGTATTIVSGAVAERVRFSSYIVLSVLISGLIYPLYGHWVWGGIYGDGWLKSLGFIDFAGSTVVHSIGGWFSLAAVLVLGPRLGRFGEGQAAIRGHQMPTAALGTFLLWFGWFGFNGGSALQPDGFAVRAIVNTVLAGGAGALGSALLAWWRHGRPHVEPMMNGVLAGLVGITAGCHAMSTGSAIVTGLVAGILAYYGAEWLVRRQIDDAVGAIPVHGLAGAWGTFAAGLFLPIEMLPAGMSYLEQLGVQLLGIGVGFAWAFGGGWLLCIVVNHFLQLRVDAAAEIDGLNISEHSASTDLYDLLREMSQHEADGDFSRTVTIDPHTEVGQVAREYNRVLARVGQEIHSREHALQLAREAEIKYRSIFENAVEGMFQTTANGRYMNANPALARIYGYDSVAELMASVTDIGSQLYVDPSRRLEFVEKLQVQGAVEGLESQVRRKDGSIIWISETATAIRDDRGILLHYEGTVEDITDRRMNEELRLEKERAEVASAAKTEFLTRMSHEIRTPLNGVIGMLELLSTTATTGQQRNYIEIGQSSANALLSVINDVLDLSKIEAGKLELESLEFDLQELLDDVTDMFAHRAESKLVALSGRITENAPCLVIGDPERLRQILVNLVGNALKFTDRGSIRVEVAPATLLGDDERLRFSVTDTGPGIPADRITRLFQAFSQVDASVSRTHGGTGLGLAICKQLVEAMHGEIGVDSELQKGTTFWFTLPLPASHRHPENPALEVLNAARILVVDDTEANRIVIRDHLRRFGCEVSTAVDADSALALVREASVTGRPFRLALVDQQLPQMDGQELALRMRETPGIENLQIAMLSSWNRSLDQLELQKLGIAACLTKPVRRSRLLNLLLQTLQPSASLGIEGDARTADQQTAPILLPILVVEDNEVNQLVTEELLRSMGYQCEIAANGRIALEACRQRDFSLVLADLQMPVMDGIEFVQELRKLEQLDARPRLRVIALSANAIASDRDRCFRAGMDEFLSKPIHRTDLLAMLRRFLGSGSQSREATKSPIPNQSACPVDLHDLRDRCGGNEGLQARVLEKFSSRLEAQVREIELLALGSDRKRLGTSAHSLKGAAATVSVQEVARAAAMIESAAKAGDLGEIDARVGELQDSVQRFQSWYHRDGVASGETPYLELSAKGTGAK